MFQSLSTFYITENLAEKKVSHHKSLVENDLPQVKHKPTNSEDFSNAKLLRRTTKAKPYTNEQMATHTSQRSPRQETQNLLPGYAQ